MEEVKGSIPFSSTPNPQVTAGFRMSGVMLDMPMGGLLGGLSSRIRRFAWALVHPRRDANSGRLAALALILDDAG